MQMNVQVATAGEIEEITNTIKKNGVNNLEYHYDDEDSIGFVSGKVYTFSKAMSIEFQDRNGPCFFSFSIGNDRYDIHYPKNEFADLLQNLTNKAKENRGFGLTLKEKISGSSTKIIPDVITKKDTETSVKKGRWQKFLEACGIFNS